MASENTINAIKKGLELKLDFIEIDIRQTLDGTIVLMHDRTINRTTTGKGDISNITWGKLQEQPIKNKGSEVIKVPSLEEVLKLFAGSRTSLLIELKKPSKYKGIDEKLHSLIDKYSISDKVQVFSFDKKFIKSFKTKYPKYKVGVFSISLIGITNLNSEIKTIGVHFISALLSPRHIKKRQREGREVFVWGVNSKHVMRFLININPDGIITGYPNVLREILRD